MKTEHVLSRDAARMRERSKDQAAEHKAGQTGIHQASETLERAQVQASKETSEWEARATTKLAELAVHQTSRAEMNAWEESTRASLTNFYESVRETLGNLHSQIDQTLSRHKASCAALEDRHRQEQAELERHWQRLNSLEGPTSLRNKLREAAKAEELALDEAALNRVALAAQQSREAARSQLSIEENAKNAGLDAQVVARQQLERAQAADQEQLDSLHKRELTVLTNTRDAVHRAFRHEEEAALGAAFAKDAPNEVREMSPPQAEAKSHLEAAKHALAVLAAERTLTSMFSDDPALRATWQRAASERADSRNDFSAARKSFWRRVNGRVDAEARAVAEALEQAGFELHGDGSAARLRDQQAAAAAHDSPRNIRPDVLRRLHEVQAQVDQRRGSNLKRLDVTLSLDHRAPAAASGRYLDPRNLRLMLTRDNVGKRADVDSADQVFDTDRRLDRIARVAEDHRKQRGPRG